MTDNQEEKNDRSVGKSECSHSPDFVSVDWFGTRYQFRKGQQADCVRVLWEAWENGRHALSQENIAEATEASAKDFRLSKVFREKNGCQHPAWGKMICQVTRGVYSLKVPESVSREIQKSFAEATKTPAKDNRSGIGDKIEFAYLDDGTIRVSRKAAERIYAIMKSERILREELDMIVKYALRRGWDLSPVWKK